MIKKCFEVIIDSAESQKKSEFIFAENLKEAQVIATRYPFGTKIIKVIEADLDYENKSNAAGVKKKTLFKINK